MRADAFHGRGLLHLYERQLDQAIADFSKAGKLEPWFGWFYCQRAVAHYRNKEYERAAEDFTKEIET
jgi:tetratricopeptide (TPR) repeat protein